MCTLPQDKVWRPLLGKSRLRGTVYSMTLCEYEDFTVAAFILPPKTTIPLHDHPSMTVAARVLRGAVHVKAFDIVDCVGCDPEPPDDDGNDECLDPHSGQEGEECKECTKRGGDEDAGEPYFVGKLSVDRTFRAPTTLTLDPLRRNVHELTSGDEGCVFLDVMMPPYDDDDHPCNYFVVEETDDGLCNLVPVDAGDVEPSIVAASWDPASNEEGEGGEEADGGAKSAAKKER